MFTCISCRIAFETAGEQRGHFSTDWHRYNMKRRVANLPPVPATSFNEKVLERREQTAVRVDPRGLACATCSKSFSSENAYRSHVQSRKHRDRELYLVLHPQSLEAFSSLPTADSSMNAGDQVQSSDSDEDEGDLADRIAAARRVIQPTDCLFCSERFASVVESTTHMSTTHSFFIPDRERLCDLSGLLAYLGEKVAVGNLCLYCPNGGREFGSLEAVRRHMRDVAHCKIAYASEEDRAELADFYAFRSVGDEDGEGDWEDVNGANDGTGTDGCSDGSENDVRVPALASDGLSLLLPSGRVLGHRALRVYYAQNFSRSGAYGNVNNDRAVQLASVRNQLKDTSQAVIPAAGGSGAFGKGLQVMKVRNAGEAAWAKRQGRSFNDKQRKEAVRTRVGFVHNNQKHFRDPMLQ